MIQHYARQGLALELWVLLALSAASLFWFELLPVVVFTAAIFWLVRLVGFGYFTLRTPPDLAIALLCVIVLATVFITPIPEKTFPQIWRALSGIALFYALVNWVSTYTKIRYLFFGIILLGVFLALFAPFSVEWAVDKLTFIPEILYNNFAVLVQDYVHPNVLGGILVLLLPFPISYLIFGWKRIKRFERLLVLAALLLIFLMLVLTRSRGAWMAAFASIFLLLLLRDRRSWILILLAGIVLLIGVYQFGIARILDAILYSNTIGGWDGRLEIWSRAIHLIRDFPFSGIGMGTFPELAEKFYAYDIYAPENIPHAHNLFMQVSLDLGIPGLVAWLSIFLSIIFISWQVYMTGRKMNDYLFTAMGAALISCQISLIVHGLMDSVTWGMVRPAPLVWIIWGIGAAVFSKINKLQVKT